MAFTMVNALVNSAVLEASKIAEGLTETFEPCAVEARPGNRILDLFENQIHFLDWEAAEDAPPNPMGDDDRGQNQLGVGLVPGHVTLSSPENDGEHDRANNLPEMEVERSSGQNQVGVGPEPGHVTFSSPENDGEHDCADKLPEMEEAGWAQNQVT